MQTHYLSVLEKGQNVTYTFYLHYKRIRSVIFRLVEGETNAFKVSLPYGTRLSEVEALFHKNKTKLLRLHQKSKVIPFNEGTYVYGKWTSLETIREDYHLTKTPLDLESFYKAMKKPFLRHLSLRVESYRAKMGIDVTYKIRIRKMKTRWATNSKKTFTLTFNEKVIHFHPDIIDALIVHELAHHFIAGHGPTFYAYLETIYPRYRQYDYWLKEHTYEGHHEPPKSGY